VEIVGLERRRRGNEGIPVYEYQAGEDQKFPFEKESFDMVMLVDVLHHDENPERLLQESARVSRKYILVKDQKVEGIFAQQRISLLDWAANDPYEVPCTYKYYTPDQWRELPQRFGFETVESVGAMVLYPAGFELLFGGKLNYMAVYDVSHCH
jgi:SAM-dependent methyltransferase